LLLIQTRELAYGGCI